MRRSVAMSISATFALTLGGLAVGATVLYVHARQDRALREADQRARALADLVGGMVGRAAAESRLDQRLCELITAHPSLRAVAVIDQLGRVRAEAGERPLLRRPANASMEGVDVRSVAYRDGQGRTSILHQVDVPLGKHLHADRPAVVSVLVDTAGIAVASGVSPGVNAAMSPAEVARFVVPLVALAALLMLLGSNHLRQRLVEPLHMLRRAAEARATDGAGWSPGVELRNEFGPIARSIASLQAEAANWRRRAQHIERHVDSQVAARTQAITQDLERAQHALWHDPLTGLMNRRVLQERFPEIFDAQREAGGDLSVIMLDLDHFKVLNDTLGHHAGDKLLRFVGALLRQFVRGGDIALRLGGDEFMLILPGVSHSHADKLARRITALFAQYASIIRGLPVRPAISAGVASLWHDHPERAEELVTLADRSMYAAKHQPRRAAPQPRALAG